MSELSPVYGGKVVHSGIFEFKELYRFMYEWFRDYQYLLLEKKYSEKIKADGKDVEIEWVCFRKISDYFRFKIAITLRIIKLVSVEVQEGGLKVNRDKGEVEIKFASWLEKDWDSKWEQNPISKFLRGVYDRYIIRSRTEHYEDKLKSELDEAMAQFKSFLSLTGNVS
jgi:hypothetical protein